MTLLVLGLIVFFAPHLFAGLRPARAAAIARLGDENRYRGLYAAISFAGLILIVWGFGRYRSAGMIPAWFPPIGLQHAIILLMWPAFVLLAAAGEKPSLIAARAKHPMLAGTALWAFGHFLANGDLGSMLLFGAFLAFSIYARIVLLRRGGKVPADPGGWQRRDTVAVLAGTVLWLAFLLGLHAVLIGVPVVPGFGFWS